MTNTVVSRRNFDQPILYTLGGDGDGLFILENVAIAVTTPGVVVSGSGDDLTVDVQGTILGARGVNAIDIAGADASVKVGADGRIAARDFGFPPGGHAVDLARGGEVVNFGRIDTGVEITAGRESARVVNTGTIDALGEDGTSISILSDDPAPVGTSVSIVNAGSVLGDTEIRFAGLTTIPIAASWKAGRGSSATPTATAGSRSATARMARWPSTSMRGA